MAPRTETESVEMLPADLERLIRISFSKSITNRELKMHVRNLVRECQRLQGALMISEMRRPNSSLLKEPKP